MNIGFIILCRLDSKRLPGKILRNIEGKPVIMYIYERLLKTSRKSNIVVATSTEKSDDPIELFCFENKINCFRGSLENVSERFLLCARYYQFDFVARINGDNIFVDINTVKEMTAITLTDNYDFISNVKNRTYPKGMSIEIVRTSHYIERYSKFTLPEHYEHVTIFLYQHDNGQRYYYHYNTLIPEAQGIQLAIDDENDFRTATKIIRFFKSDHTNYGLKDVIYFLKRINEK